MADTIQCAIHGERNPAYVCNHLIGDVAGLGFNRHEPCDDDPFPDAWCDDCEIIRVEHNGWNEESEKLVSIKLLCSGCYDRARIRNTLPETTLDDLADLRWKCGSCDEWHTGPCLDFGSDSPVYWDKEYEKNRTFADLLPPWKRKAEGTFLNADFCAIKDRDFFVRGIISLPIIGTAKNFRWGVWGSLSRENFRLVTERNNDPSRIELPPMFSWLSTRLPEYPDTLNLKMYAYIQPVGLRPEFELEHADHLLAQEFHHGMSPARVKELMMLRLRDTHL